VSTWSDLIRDALIEIGVQDPIETVDPNMQSLGLLRLNSILNQWNAKGEASYTATFPTYTTTASLSPHTIGPTSATWSATQRPVDILGANRVLSSGTGLVRIPIAIRDAVWWFSQLSAPNIETGIPTDLYYAPTFPNGSIYFWPVPSEAYTVALMVRLILGDALDEDDLGTDIALPPGYYRAISLSLAEDLVTPLTVPMPQQLPSKATQARAVIFGVNTVSTRIRTRQSGVPRGAPSGATFNWHSRSF
jgi:hypothetical protein